MVRELKAPHMIEKNGLRRAPVNSACVPMLSLSDFHTFQGIARQQRRTRV